MKDFKSLCSLLSSRIDSWSDGYSTSLNSREQIEVSPSGGRDFLSTPVLCSIARFCKEFELSYIVRVRHRLPVVVIYSF